MITVAHYRAQIAPVDAHRRKVALPADRVERVEWVGHRREVIAPFDVDAPSAISLLLCSKGGIDRRYVEHGGIEDRVGAEHALVGQAVAVVRRLDEENGHGTIAFDPPHRAAGQYDIIAVAKSQMAEIAEQAAAALVDEDQLVAVAVAHQAIHASFGAPLPKAQMRVRQHGVGLPRRGGNRVDSGEVESTWAQRPFPARPAGRRMDVIELRRGPKKTLLTHLALIGAGGQ